MPVTASQIDKANDSVGKDDEAVVLRAGDEPRNRDAYDAYVSASKRETDTNGWIEIKDNPISRTGVFPYMGVQLGKEFDADKIYQVYRPAEELNHPECLESFKLLPWVDDHTMLGPEGSNLTPAEEKGVQGVTGQEIYFRDGTLYANLKLFSNALADLIERGKKQLSAGYRCFYEKVSGVFEGQPYDAIQRKIRGNHLALVMEGRMGPEVAVQDCSDGSFVFTLDAKDIPMTEEETKKKETEDKAAKDAAEAEEKSKKEAADKAARDAEEEKKKDCADKSAKDKAKDEGEPDEEESKKDKKEGMDAAISMAVAKAIAPFQSELNALKSANHTKSVLSEVAQRDVLAGKISDYVGTFDHADKTLAEVAGYGVEKLGLKCPKGTELVALDAYFHDRKPQTQGVGLGMDSAKPSEGLSKFLSAAQE